MKEFLACFVEGMKPILGVVVILYGIIGPVAIGCIIHSPWTLLLYIPNIALYGYYIRNS
jgi:hypothetical protein